MKIIYALSPQAKGKIERPYQWLQDRIVRTCVRENVTDIRKAQTILNQEMYRYNYRQVHSTTQEIPYLRFQQALQNKKSLFREFSIPQPYQSVKDIFGLRLNRMVHPYRRISLNNLLLKVNGVTLGDRINLRIYPINNGLSEVRFWCDGHLVDVQRIKNRDLNILVF